MCGRDIDPIDVLAARKSGPRSLRRLSRLVATSTARVWAAGPRVFLVIIGLQVLAAAALTVQVLAVERVLSVILDVADDPDALARLWLPVGVLAGATAVTNLTGATLASLGLGVALVSLHPALLPLLLLGGAPLVITSRRESKLEFDFAVSQTPNERMREYLTMLQTGRDEAAEVRAFGLAPELQRRLDALYRTYFVDLERHVRRRSVLSAIGNIGAAVALALTLVVLVWLVAQGGVSVSAAGAAIVAIRMLASQVQAISGGIRLVFESGLFLDDVASFLDLDVTDDDPALVAVPPAFTTLTTEDLTFTYPGSDAPALDGVRPRHGRRARRRA